MVTVVDLITFFGVASFFAWLTYGPLQGDLLKEFRGSNVAKARRNFYTVNDYFLVSFLFYSADIVGEYVLHSQRLFLIGLNPMYNDGFLRLIIAVCFFGGLLTLGVPVWYLRSVQKGNRILDYDLLPDFSFTLYVSGVTVIGFGLLGIGLEATYLQWWWGFFVWLAAGLVGMVGAVLMIGAYQYELRKFKFIGGLMNLAPIIFYLVLRWSGYL